MAKAKSSPEPEKAPAKKAAKKTTAAKKSTAAKPKAAAEPAAKKATAKKAAATPAKKPAAKKAPAKKASAPSKPKAAPKVEKEELKVEETVPDTEADEIDPVEAERVLERLTIALAMLDDDTLRHGLASMRESSRLDVASQLGLSRASMHLGDALVPLFRRKMVTAPPVRQLSIAFAISEDCNDDTVEALGDRHAEPTREDMLEVLPGIIEAHGQRMTTLMLAAYGASNAQCQPVFSALVDEDERFALPKEAPPVPEGDIAPLAITTLPSRQNDPDQEAKRDARREAKAAKKAAEQARKQSLVGAQQARRSAQHKAKKRKPGKH